MVRSNFRHLLEDQLKVFGDIGYSVKSKVLNASDFGVAQERKRIFLVGIRADFDVAYSFPNPTHGIGCTKPKLTIRDAIGQLPEWPEGEFYDMKFHWYYMSRDRRKNWEEQSRTIVANPRHMPLHPLSPLMVKHGHNDWRFDSDARARRFSYREAAALQGFDNLVFPITENMSLNKCYEVTGNAVPPPLFKAVADSLPNIWD